MVAALSFGLGLGPRGYIRKNASLRVELISQCCKPTEGRGPCSTPGLLEPGVRCSFFRGLHCVAKPVHDLKNPKPSSQMN